MADQKTMEEARTWNADVDAALQSGGVVDRSLYLQLLEAYRYDTASSVGWVEAKMKVLLDRVRRGKELSLFVASMQEQKLIGSEEELQPWIGENFPSLSF